MKADISVASDEWQALPRDPAAMVLTAVAAVADVEDNGPGAMLDLLLTDDETLRSLNARFRGIDKPTNVLAFPADEPPGGPAGQDRHIGDIAIAYETVMREAAEQEKTFNDHFMHMVVHGTLHLLGYDHQDETERLSMEAQERRILASLGIPDPYDDD